MEKLSAKQIIDAFNLEPLIGEGGYFKQTFLGDEMIPKEVLPGRKGDRPSYTVILYLITEKAFSRMHRLPTDEIFHYYMGDSAQQLQLYPDGSSKIYRLGSNILSGDQIQVNAPRGCFQGTRKLDGEYGWSLLGTTMGPGFMDDDYEDGDMEELIKQYPQEEELIRILAGDANYGI